MVYIDGVKYACERCIRGHRVTGCNHTNMPLTMIKPKGRPSTQCAHCKELKKHKSSTGKSPILKTKCTCPAKVKKTKPILLDHPSTMATKQQHHHPLLNNYNKLDEFRLADRPHPNSLFYNQDDVDSSASLQFTLQKQPMPNFNSLNNGLAHHHHNNNNNNSIFDDFLPPLIQMSNPGSQWPATPSATTTPSSSCTEDFISDSSSSDSLFFDLPKSSAPGHSTLRSNNIPGNAANPNYVDDFFALNTAPGNSGSPLLSSLEPSYQQPFLSLQHQQFQHQQKLPPLDAISPALTVPGSFI